MAAHAFRTEEQVGLAAAVVLHGALVAVLAMQTMRSEVPIFPERMTVSLAIEVGLEAASPDPVAESRAAIAPTLSDSPAPAPAAAKPEPAARPAPNTPPKPRPAARTATSTPAPSRDRSRPDRTPPRPAATPTRAAANGGGSRIGDDFLEGKGSSTTTTETRVPASQIGASAKASIRQAFARQVKPHWTAPQGVEVDQLISLVDFDLNPDGSLKGRPTCKTVPSSITESNSRQAGVHCQNAIRAVQLAAPFKLPEEYYEAWKTIRGARFDRNTSR
jgi:hypothetical protein